jgi:hypothetical protein
MSDLEAIGAQLMHNLEQSPTDVMAEQTRYHKAQQEKYQSGVYDEDVEVAVQLFTDYTAAAVTPENNLKNEKEWTLPVSKATISMATVMRTRQGEEMKLIDVCFNYVSIAISASDGETELRAFIKRRLT